MVKSVFIVEAACQCALYTFLIYDAQDFRPKLNTLVHLVGGKVGDISTAVEQPIPLPTAPHSAQPQRGWFDSAARYHI